MPASNPENTPYILKFIDYSSEEYLQAARLRYRLFYEEHNIPYDSIFNPQEERDLHLAIVTHSNRVLAYGRLGENSSIEFQIYQMVVAPDSQGCGLGKAILQGLFAKAVERGANVVVLNARVAKMGFYQKYGFQPVGRVFASSMTNVPHIKMEKCLHRNRFQSSSD